MAAMAHEADRSHGALVDLDLLDRAVRAAALTTGAVHVRCTNVEVRPDTLVLELELQLKAQPACHHIEGLHAEVTGV